MPAPPDWTPHLPAGLDPGAVDLRPAANLAARFIERWRERGDAPTLQDTDGTWYGADELEARTRTVALRLRAAGLRTGDRLVIAAQSSAAFVIGYVAALRAGLTVVTLNLAYTRPEITAIVGDARPAAALVDDDEKARWIRDAAGGELAVHGLDVELADGLDDGSLDAAGSEDTALIIYTSGTTGAPKGVPLSHANLLASASAVNLAWRWTPEDRLLLALPLFHVHGLGVGINGSLCAGAAVLVRPRFDVQDIAAHAGHGATLFFGVPTMYERLTRAGRGGDLRRLRLLVSGSAPLSAQLAQAVAEQSGQLPLERYGMTETIMLTGNPYDGERRPGTVGFPFPGVELRLGELDEVQVRGPNVITGYLDRPQATAQAFTHDGWFRTGDLGEFDADGYLRLVGRSKELIITGGYNVYPREVEEALASHPAVREVAVVGRPSEQWGEQVTAVVVADAEVDGDALRAHAAQSLAPYKVPKAIEFAAELPRNAMGKVVRGEL
ncbi:MAG: malonyl-CoA/methylmalonyl-CoA synthetase [Solirubrobacteraceae bacterium]|nr:malonyl-CoA/methylmalonyl-CoA synthetase [Solirubrobacteraceae bacterium]